MKKHTWIIYLVGGILLVGLGWLVHTRVHFQWSVFFDQVQHVDWRRIAIAAFLILACYWLRATRWAILVRPQKKVGTNELVGPQVIGFAALALLGRPADLVRPYLVARKISLSVSSQVAVYTVERMFDLAASALIFSCALLLAPDRATLPHHEALQRSAIGGLALTLILAVFAVTVRLSGKAVAGMVQKTLGSLSPKLGHSVASKILAFRDGLDSIATLGDSLRALGLSLVIWGMVTTSYLQICLSFVRAPQLASMTLARCLVLMAASMVGSMFQLPVLGWFTQIGVTTGMMQQFFHVQFEPALACGAMLLIVTFMLVVPFGLILARMEHVSLKKVTEESEQLGHDDSKQTPVASEV